MFYDPWRALTNLTLAEVWALRVRRLFEHEKLARPSDTGHYVVAARLFHHSQAKWDTVPGHRADSQAWIFTAGFPLGVVSGAAGCTAQCWRATQCREKSDQVMKRME